MALCRIAVLLSFLLSFVATARAQDTRSVSEPRYPPICKILYADLTQHNGRLQEEPIEKHYRDNDRIRKAMEGCPAGKSVVLHGAKTGRTIFLIGPLKLRAGITLVVDSSAAVWGSRDPRDYDVAPGSCGILVPPSGSRGPGCLPLILAEDAPHSGLIGEGVVDGRGGNRMIGSGQTWWELAHRARVEDMQQVEPHVLVVRRSPDFTMYRITLRNSPNCHVTIEQTDGFTAWGVHLDTPKWARNTDGIDPQAGSSNISIIDSFIRAGDDNISPKASAGAGSVTHMTVRNTHFYNGHGFGIGSQTAGGISALRVDGLTIDGSTNGLRIRSDRSRGGLVDDVRFENVCMRGVENPIVLNPLYTPFDGSRLPVYRNILLRNVRSLGPGAVTLAGLDSAHRLEATLDTVTIDSLRPAEVAARHAVLAIRHGNLDPSGDDVRTTGANGGAAYPCDGRFVPFEQNTISPVSDELIPPQDDTFYVAADGSGDYYSVQAAVSRVPATGGIVLVAPGVYRERVFVAQAHVTLKSANPDPRKTVIVFDLSRATQANALGTATLRVRGDNFTLENLTVENDYGRTHKQDQRNAGTRALLLAGDRAILRNVHLLSDENTLYASAKDCGEANGSSCEAGRSYITHSYIAGNLDFIYGDGLTYFDECELHSTDHPPGGVITAQGKHYASQESGFIFRNTRLTADANAGRVLLGRPWRDYATVVFLNPQLGSQIAPPAWRDSQPGSRRGEQAYFRIFNPAGPGAPTQSKELTPQEASHYSPREVLGGKDGWDPR